MKNAFSVVIFDAASDRKAKHCGQLGLNQFRYYLQDQV